VDLAVKPRTDEQPYGAGEWELLFQTDAAQRGIVRDDGCVSILDCAGKHPGVGQ